MELVELLVRMDCLGCERKVRKQLSKLKGVDSVEIDLRMNKVTVFGYVDRKKVLKAVRKTGKRAEFWQEGFDRVAKYSNDGSHDDTYYSYSSNGPSFFGSHILKNHPFKRTYNYVKHGYNHYEFGNDERTYSHDSTSDVPSIFSDENPNNCSVM